MAKKIKFPLELAGGVQVRTLEELREHFDLVRIIGYYLDGKLLTWLTDRYYETEALNIRELNSESPDFKARLCTIFGVENNFDHEIDLEAVERRNAKIAKLKQVIDDEEIIKQVDSVAFDQEELADILDDGKSIIYLCNNVFYIPLRIEGITYYGLGEAIIDNYYTIKDEVKKYDISLANVLYIDESNNMIHVKGIDQKYFIKEEINNALSKALQQTVDFSQFYKNIQVEEYFDYKQEYSSEKKAIQEYKSGLLEAYCNLECIFALNSYCNLTYEATSFYAEQFNNLSEQLKTSTFAGQFRQINLDIAR